LKIKLKGRHFDTIDVIEAALQSMLNTLTEHDFQDAFKKMAEVLGMVHTCGRGLLQE
jgi:predicted helicase